MSEGEFNRNIDYDKSFQGIIQLPDSLGFVSRFESFETTRGDLYTCLLDLNNQLNEGMKSGEVPFVSPAKVADDFGGIAKILLEEGNKVNDVVDACADLMRADVKERESLFGDMLGEDFGTVLGDEEKLKIISRGLIDVDSREAVILLLATTYYQGLSSDIDVFVERLAEKHPPHHTHDSGSSEQTIEIKKGLRDHATDLAKIAFGVAAGLALDHYMNRRKRG